MTEWREVRLGELVRCQSGFAFMSRDWTTVGVPVVKIRDVRSGVVRLDGGSFVAEDTAAAAERFLLRRGDVLITMSGEIGSVGVYKHERPALLNQRVGRFELLNSEAADLDFLAFALQDPAQKRYFESVAYGVAQPNISPSLIGRAPVRIPSLGTQRRIAAVLAVFDELIAINERRIELLEAVVRSLYREWFVRFRFPGHELNLANGEAPDGWEVGTVGEFLNVIGGGTPSKREPPYWEGGTVDWYTPSDLTRSKHRHAHGSADRITELGVQKGAARLFAAGSVLMTSRATLGVLVIATSSATCNQGFIVLPPADGISSTFLYEWLADQKSRLESIATGATFKEITKGAFKHFPFVKPSNRVLEAFADVVAPIEDEICTLECANRALARTRNLLLPRLVTGRLDISDVDLGDLITEEIAA